MMDNGIIQKLHRIIEFASDRRNLKIGFHFNFGLINCAMPNRCVKNT